MTHIIFELEGFSTENHTILRQRLDNLNTNFIICENDRLDKRALATELDLNTFINIISGTCALITLILAIRETNKKEKKKLSSDEVNEILYNLQKRFQFSLLPEIKLQLKAALLKEEKPILFDLPTELGEYRIVVTEGGHTYYLQGSLLK